MSPPPRIWFVCPDYDRPAGGVRGIYQFVDHLNDAGVPAAVVHERRGFRCTWFEHETPIVYADDADPVPGVDLLVIPVVFGPRIAHIGPGVSKAILNQGAFASFREYPIVPTDEPTAYEHPEVIGAVCVSDHDVDYMRFAFPSLPVDRVFNGIDPRLFHPEPKLPLVTFMPRKNAQDVQQVLYVLRARDALRDVQLAPLHELSHQQVAEIQRRALVFLSFGHPEGFGRPPAEAMACGAVVVGYHGMGGREFLTPEHAYPVPMGDIVTYARAVEEVLDRWRSDPDELARFAAQGAAAIQARYSPATERDSVVRVFGGLLERAEARAEHGVVAGP